ncbi:MULTISPECIES: polysaccharide deacetylase family protein [unclassified Modestobacter]
MSDRRSRRRWFRLASLTLATALALALAGYRVATDVPVDTASATAESGPDAGWRPVANDCSGGHVTFTFDDGPRQYSSAVLDRLAALRLQAVFFWTGSNVLGRQHLVRRALADGHVIGNHTFDHPDLVTGVLPDGERIAPWGPEQVRAQFERTNELLVSYGAPAPQYYRPPYGSIDSTADDVARELRLRLVMSFGLDEEQNIVDSHDTEGLPTAAIVANVTRGMTDGAIITMHDGRSRSTPTAIEALQPIVDVMNDRKLCSTTAIPPDATGGALERAPQNMPE